MNRRIEKLGGWALRQRGSHRYFIAQAGEVTCHTAVPQRQHGDIPIGTLRKIEKDLEAVFGKGWLR